MSLETSFCARKLTSHASLVPDIWLCGTGAENTAPIAGEAEVSSPSAEHKQPPQSPRHKPLHAYKAKDGRTPVFRPPSTAQFGETTPQAAQYETPPAPTSDFDAHPEAGADYEDIPPDLAAYEADQTQPSIEYGTTYPKSVGYETDHPSTAELESHRPAVTEYENETTELPPTGHGVTQQPVTEASQPGVMYEDEAPAQPSGGQSGEQSS